MSGRAVPASSGLPRSARVRKRAEFQRIQSGGRRVNTPHFVLVLAKTPADRQSPRLGITASRKVGVAVVRNRAKRLVRVAFRSTPELWPQGCDVVVIVRRALVDLRAADVIAEWREVAPVLARRAADVLRASAAPKDPEKPCPPRGRAEH